MFFRMICVWSLISTIGFGLDHAAAQEPLDANDRLNAVLDVDLQSIRKYQPMAHLSPDGRHLVDRLLNQELFWQIDRIAIGMEIPRLDPDRLTPLFQIDRNSCRFFCIIHTNHPGDVIKELGSFRHVKSETLDGIAVEILEDGDYQLMQRGQVLELRHKIYTGKELSECFSEELLSRWQRLSVDSQLRVALQIPAGLQSNVKVPQPQGRPFQLPSHWDKLVAALSGGSLEMDLSGPILLDLHLDARNEEWGDYFHQGLGISLQYARQLFDLYTLVELLNPQQEREITGWLDGLSVSGTSPNLNLKVERPVNLDSLVLAIRNRLMDDPGPVMRQPILNVDFKVDLQPDANGTAVEISGQSNLPAGTRLKVTASPDDLIRPELVESLLISITADGSFSGTLRPNNAFKVGKYQIQLTSLGQDQPADVASVIGKNGAFIAGPDIQQSADAGNYLLVSQSTEIRAALDRKALQREKQKLRQYRRKILDGHEVLVDMFEQGVFSEFNPGNQKLKQTWQNGFAEVRQEIVKEVAHTEAIWIFYELNSRLQIVYSEANASPPLGSIAEPWYREQRQKIKSAQDRFMESAKTLQEFIDSL